MQKILHLSGERACLAFRMAVAIGLIVVATSCRSRTMVGGFSDSPDGRAKLLIGVHGAPGHAYDEETLKEIVLEIKSKRRDEEALLAKRHYRVSASCLDWKVSWDNGTEVILTFFDYGPGLDSAEAKRDQKPIRVICTLRYRFDSQRRSYSEIN
jgi:hypothetical protein